MRNHLVTYALAALLAAPLLAAHADAAELELDWAIFVGPNLDANILAGETIRWTWIDTSIHTVTSTSGPTSFDSGLITGFGSTYSQTFNQEGIWDYECTVHGGFTMGGVINVPESGAPLMLLSGGAFLAILGRRRYAT